MFDLLLLRDVLDAETRETILAAMRASTAAAATVYGQSAGGAIESRIRNTRKAEVPPAIREMVLQRVLAFQPRLEEHFSIALGRCEEPQFLRYEPGDFFVAHQDGNLEMLRDDSRDRRISIVLFLDVDHAGGVLTFHGPFPQGHVRREVRSEPGTLVAFRSETTHEVTPVTAGERSTIVSWFRRAGA